MREWIQYSLFGNEYRQGIIALDHIIRIKTKFDDYGDRKGYIHELIVIETVKDTFIIWDDVYREDEGRAESSVDERDLIYLYLCDALRGESVEMNDGDFIRYIKVS